MNMDNLNEEEKARHKQQQVEYRNKKRFSSIFLFIATIFEIIETFIIILLLIIGSIAITTRFVDVNSTLFSNILGIIIIVFSLGGLVIGFIIYKKAMGWAINKFNLKDKLLDDVTSHYIKKDENEEKLR
ncbi:MAG: hypothetical protein SPH83_08145 [Treponema sp.]|nr:hypothetical protein [Spirochaetales bacterium]MDY6190454.1 hypothetical protein [Treponema sp.]